MNRTSPRSILFSFFILFFLTHGEMFIAQNKAVHPSIIKKADSFGQVSNIKTNNHFSSNIVRQQHKDEGDKQVINSGIRPLDFHNKPSDPGEQRQMTEVNYSMKITSNFPGQYTDQGINPSDANGDVNENYYVQVINSKYSVYNKATSSPVLDPLSLNNLFNQALPGANLPIRDPTVLWDELAGKWVFSGFSENKTPFLTTDYILLAVSVSSDPTGLWNSWSFIADGKPDYPKLGIWRDGYYMGTHTNYGSDIYVFERDAMIAGEPYPQMIKFDHALVETPNTWNQFSCLLPLDNDGSWAPVGTPGQFITVADDDQNNPLDALYIYELSVDWISPPNSIFAKTQELEVNPFWGNFDTALGAIPQQGTNTKLSPNSTVLMHRAQYRNFNGTQKIVCNHTIGEAADQTAIRWYELEKIGTGPWGIRQQGTFNPASSLYIFSRWNASIAMNDLGEIALGYSISGAQTFPGIRCCGQSKSAPLNTMDIGETTIFDGTVSSTAIHSPYRWGDYANMAVDPSDGVTFWFTSEYVKDNIDDDVIKGTQIASLRLGVLVDQLLSNGNTHIGTVGRWDGNQFTESTVPSLFYFPDDESQVLKAYQDVVANEKYSYWKSNNVVDNDVVNYKNIPIYSYTDKLISQFNPAKNATLQCLLENSVTADTLGFKDPWFIDYADPLYNNQLRNRGMKTTGNDALIFQPVAYTANNLGTNASHKGVFLLQDYSVPGKPYHTNRWSK